MTRKEFKQVAWDAETIEDIVYEMLTTRVSERQGRAIDRDEAAAMERKKRDGYF